MKKTIAVYPTGHAFIGKQVAEQGYVGDVDALFNAVTIVLIKPNTDLETVKKSLQITLQDIDLRIQEEKKQNGK